MLEVVAFPISSAHPVHLVPAVPVKYKLASLLLPFLLLTVPMSLGHHWLTFCFQRHVAVFSTSVLVCTNMQTVFLYEKRMLAKASTFCASVCLAPFVP